jgi:RsiW-degrading membrane proteinase PrsW (M82 family)
MGITIAAIITALAALLLYGFVIRRASAPEDHKMLLVALLIALPLQPLAYYLVRLPVDISLVRAFGQGGFLTAMRLLYAPLIEEPAKWIVIFVPFIADRVSPRNAIALALAVGLGFGLGEIGFIAYNYAQVPAVAALPFYSFAPFFIERMAVCFIHGGFIALAYKLFAEDRNFIAGGVFGMVLHFILNFPIYLAEIDLFRIGQMRWGLLLTALLLLMTLFLAVLVWRLGGEEFRARLKRGKAAG